MSEKNKKNRNKDRNKVKEDKAEIRIEEEKSAPKNAQAKAAANAYAQSEKLKEEGVGEKVEVEVADKEEVKDEKVVSDEPDYKALALKTAAEFDNFRKRISKEKAQWKRESLASFLKEFLPAFDDMDRAIAEGEKSDSYEIIHDGVKLVRDNMWKSMEKNGVVEIVAAGKKFDPRYHEAMTMIPMPGVEANSVIEVFQTGYMVDDFVLRPAKVVVAAEIPSAVEKEEAPAAVSAEEVQEDSAEG